MLTAQLDPTATATWGGVVAMIVIFALDKIAGYFRDKNKSDVSAVEAINKSDKASVEAISQVNLSIEKQNTTMERNHGETKVSYASLSQKIEGIHNWLEEVANGNTPHVASSNALLAQHEHTLENHSGRIIALENLGSLLDTRQKGGLERMGQLENTIRRCPTCRETETGHQSVTK